MNVNQFAQGCFQEKQNQLKQYFEENSTQAGALIKQLNLPQQQHTLLYQLLDTALTNAYYTMLLALDGSASLGENPQQVFQVISEDGTALSECGELEAAAYEAFHEIQR